MVGTPIAPFELGHVTVPRANQLVTGITELQAALDATAWNPLASLGGGIAVSGGVPGVRKEGNRAFMIGRLTGTLTGVINPLFTVPVGFYPGNLPAGFDFLSFIAPCTGTSAAGQCRIRVYINGIAVADNFSTSGLNGVALDQLNWPLS